MKLIIVDFLRRWWVSYLMVAVFVALMATAMTMTEGYVFGVLLQVPFLFEQGRRPHGVLAVMPVARRTIGLSYWWLAVVLPAVVVTGSAGLVGLLCSPSGISWKTAGFVFAGSFVFAGCYTCSFYLVSRFGLRCDLNGATAYIVLFLFFPALLIAFAEDFVETREHTAEVFLVGLIGMLLTLWGYMWSKKLAFGQRWKRRRDRQSTALSAGRMPSLKPRMTRFGEIFFESGWRMFLGGLAGTTLLLLFETRKNEGDLSRDSNFLPFFFVFAGLGSVMIRVGGARFLRSLPLSTNRLAFVLMLTPLLSILAVIAGVAAIQWLKPGHLLGRDSANFMIPTAGVVCFACTLVVRYPGRENGYVKAMLLGMLGTMVIVQLVAETECPAVLWWLLGLGLMTAAFFLNRHWLRCSDSYRTSTAFGTRPRR